MPLSHTARSTVPVAVVQATPAVLDAEATVDKACSLVAEAAKAGARLVALPEVFVALYPSACWAHASARFSHAASELHRRMWASAVDVPGPLTARLGRAAQRARAWVAIGVNERDPARPGTLWNALLLFGPDGELALHRRKLLPTLHERVFWGRGPGTDLDVVESDIGRIGGLSAGRTTCPGPWGNLLAGPVSGREEILDADCDRGAVIAARRVFDTQGNYRRADLE